MASHAYSSWLRFAGARTYHRTGPNYIRYGRSLCGRLDLTRTGYELIGGETTEPIDRRHKRCGHCLRRLQRLQRRQASEVQS